jgi:DHA1 family multidrug resistance protein-like MFS transporter
VERVTQSPERNRIFIILFIATFVAMLGVGVIAPTMPIYAKTLGATGFWLGTIYASFSLSRLVFMPITGRLSDTRGGRKGFLLTGLMIYALASLGYIWSGSVAELTWIRLLHGIGSAMVIPIASAVVGDISPRGSEGRMMGNFQIALFLGFGAGPLLGGAVMQVWGINAVFMIMGAMTFLSFLVIAYFLPEDRSSGRTRKERVQKGLWRTKTFRALFIFRFTNAIGRAAILSFLPVFADQLQISAFRVGILVSVNIFITALLQNVTGKMADRFSRRTMIVTGNGVAGFALILFPLARNFSDLMLLGSILGIGSAFAFPAASAVATNLGRDYGMGHVMGQFNMAMSLGAIVGAVVTGALMDLFQIDVVFIFSGLIGILGALFCQMTMDDAAPA